MLQSMVDSQVEAEGWEAPPEAALDRGSLHTALQARYGLLLAWMLWVTPSEGSRTLTDDPRLSLTTAS